MKQSYANIFWAFLNRWVLFSNLFWVHCFPLADQKAGRLRSRGWRRRSGGGRLDSSCRAQGFSVQTLFTTTVRSMSTI